MSDHGKQTSEKINHCKHPQCKAIWIDGRDAGLLCHLCGEYVCMEHSAAVQINTVGHDQGNVAPAIGRLCWECADNLRAQIRDGNFGPLLAHIKQAGVPR